MESIVTEEKTRTNSLTPEEIIKKAQQFDSATLMRAIVHVLKGDLREDYQNLEIRTGGSPSCPQYYLMTQVPLSQSIPIKEKYWTWTGRKERVIGQKTHEDLELAMAYPCQSTLTVKVNNRKLIAASEKLAKRAKVKLCIDLEGKLTI